MKLWIGNSLLWLASLLWLELGMVEALLLFAFYIVVPLGLFLTETVDREGRLPKTYTYALYLLPFMAILTSLSYLFPQGKIAGILSLGWLCFTLLVSIYGLLRFLARGAYPMEELAIDVGLIYMVVGGVWFSLHRFGLPVLHFDAIIIQLTAIHFHYSAFIAPIFIGLLGRVLRKEGKLSVAYYIIAIGIMLGQMGVAFGITYARLYEFIFVLLFVLCLYGYCYLSIFTIRKYLASRIAKLLLLISACSLLLTMFLAFYYALGRVLYLPLISIPDMVLLHGFGNAFGFVFLGLVAWLIVQPKINYAYYGIPHSRLKAGWKVGSSFFAEEIKTVEAKGNKAEQAIGLVDDMNIYERHDLEMNKVAPLIKQFYENTLQFTLVAQTRWSRGFRIFSRLYTGIFSRLEQLNLARHQQEEEEMLSRIIPIPRERDGRSNVRAWIRSSAKTKKAIFVAAYAYHVHQQVAYMNIALPLPYGNMTGILRLDHLPDTKLGNGLMLSSFSPKGGGRGDEGIYFFARAISIRLPLRERLYVQVDPTHPNQLKAEHEMWIFGIKFLTIQYKIFSEHKLVKY